MLFVIDFTIFYEVVNIFNAKSIKKLKQIMKDKFLYKKKVIVSDERATPEARAERLRQIRNMANLSRKQLCADNLINFNTYKGWELATSGGLPLDGAQQVIDRVKKEGVVCTLDWLIYGKGFGPYIVDETRALKKEQESFEEISCILNEVYLFKKQFFNAIHAQIADDGLEPDFHIKDFVGGIQHDNKNLEPLLNQKCLIILSNGQTLVRYLKRGSEPNTFLLLCSNPKTKQPNLNIHPSEIVEIALISRYYKIVFQKHSGH